MTILWNDGDPHASLDPRPGTNPCPAPQRDDKHKYSPATDRWKLNIVEGETKEHFHGKWIHVSNYDDKSDINITSLWHKLKDKIEAGEVAVIKMACPPPSWSSTMRFTPPPLKEIWLQLEESLSHLSSTIIICYTVGQGLFREDKKTLYWIRNNGSPSF